MRVRIKSDGVDQGNVKFAVNHHTLVGSDIDDLSDDADAEFIVLIFNIENANFEDTGFSYTLSLISGKHKMVILYCLMEFEPVRFNELRRYVKNISDKTLSSNLKELESDGLISRKEYPQIPPKVEYSLTGRGKSLMEVLDQLCIWGENNRK